MSKECFYIDSHGPNETSVRNAFRWLLRRPESHAYIAVMQQSTLKGIIQNVIGEDGRKELIKDGGTLSFDGKTVSLITERRMIGSGNDCPIIVFWPFKDFLDKIDSIPNVSAILVVPQTIAEVQEWIMIRDAKELTTGKRLNVESSMDPIVEEALKDLNGLVNRETGLAHPSDKETAVQIFNALLNGGIEYDPSEVKRWLVQKGWTSSNAEEVKSVAGKIKSGIKMRPGQNKLGRDPLKKWKKRAEA